MKWEVKDLGALWDLILGPCFFVFGIAALVAGGLVVIAWLFFFRRRS